MRVNGLKDIQWDASPNGPTSMLLVNKSIATLPKKFSVSSWKILCASETGIDLGFASDAQVSQVTQELYENVTHFMSDLFDNGQLNDMVNDAYNVAAYGLACQIFNLVLMIIGFGIGYYLGSRHMKVTR